MHVTNTTAIRRRLAALCLIAGLLAGSLSSCTEDKVAINPAKTEDVAGGDRPPGIPSGPGL